VKERVITFGTGAALVGVVTEPALGMAPDGAPAVLFLNSGLIHRVGPNRLYVRMARAMADRGMVAFRFDHSGIGDSRAATDRLSITDRWVAEIRASMDMLESTTDARRFVLVGNCSGAAAAYLTGEADPRVVALGLINPQGRRILRYYLRLVTGNPASWRRLTGGRAKLPRLRIRAWRGSRASDGGPRRSHSFVEGLSSLAERGVDLMLACSEWDPGYDFFLRKHREQLLRPGLRERIALEVVEGANHDLGLVANQDRLLRLVERWVATLQETRWR